MKFNFRARTKSPFQNRALHELLLWPVDGPVSNERCLTLTYPKRNIFLHILYHTMPTCFLSSIKRAGVMVVVGFQLTRPKMWSVGHPLRRCQNGIFPIKI